jgi:polysaccharide biosynthesis/export protein
MGFGRFAPSSETMRTNSLSVSRCVRTGVRVFAAAGMLSAVCVSFTGCKSTVQPISAATKVAPDIQTLNPGDVIKISFPSASNLDTSQQIRRDGRINLQLIGELKVTDKTPGELEKELQELYASQLTSKEVSVNVVASSFSVYVTGAVMRPGKISPERAITVFDAISEAGGLDGARANPKKVRVIRQEGLEVKTYILNMKAVLEGKDKEPFYLKAYDTVHVPEKIQLF